MPYPEYLSLFSNQGEFKVQVIFKSSDSCVSDSKMNPDEILKLIDQTTGQFYEKIYFDDHLHNIYKYEIDPSKHSLKIKVS